MAEIIVLVILAITGAITLLQLVIQFIRYFIKKWIRKEDKVSVKVLIKKSIFLGGMIIIMGILGFISQRTTSTPPIREANGEIAENSIAELRRIELNGRKEWISIRGYDRSKAILLFLAGGPGGTQLVHTRKNLAELEKDFVIVNWEQPGSGKSYYAINRKELTPDIYTKDGIALTEYLREEFSQNKILLAGESWGSALGIFMAAEKPEYYSAFIGIGQMVSFLETEKIDYQKGLEIAQKRGDSKKVEKLKKNGEPPYYKNVAMQSADYLLYLNSEMYSNPEVADADFNTMEEIFSPEYGVIDKLSYLLGLVKTFGVVYPQLYEIDLRKDYQEMSVPIYFFIGRHDLNAPTELVEDYYNILSAPKKELIWFEHSGHGTLLTEPIKTVQEIRKIAAANP